MIDRWVRLLISELLILGAYFWVGGALSIVLYILGLVALVTAITEFCGLYKVIRLLFKNARNSFNCA